jgi:hypothetical protein
MFPELESYKDRLGEQLIGMKTATCIHVLYKRVSVSQRRDISYLAVVCSSHDSRMYKRGQTTPPYKVSSCSVLGQAMRL